MFVNAYTVGIYNSLINLCSDNFMVKMPNRYLLLLYGIYIYLTSECLETTNLLHDGCYIKNEHLNVPTFVCALLGSSRAQLE